MVFSYPCWSRRAVMPIAAGAVLSSAARGTRHQKRKALGPRRTPELGVGTWPSAWFQTGHLRFPWGTAVRKWLPPILNTDLWKALHCRFIWEPEMSLNVGMQVLRVLWYEEFLFFQNVSPTLHPRTQELLVGWRVCSTVTLWHRAQDTVHTQWMLGAWISEGRGRKAGQTPKGVRAHHPVVSGWNVHMWTKVTKSNFYAQVCLASH